MVYCIKANTLGNIDSAKSEYSKLGSPIVPRSFTSSINVTINPIGKVNCRANTSPLCHWKFRAMNEIGRIETIARKERMLKDIEKSVLQGVLYNTDCMVNSEQEI
jgi:hypothetical protein